MKKVDLILSVLFVFLTLFTFSCIPQKKIVYLQGKMNDSIFIAQDSFSYKVNPRDILHITIVSPDERVSAFFNIQQTPSQSVSAASTYLNGYVVDDSGKVNLPIIGRVEVKDKTLSQIQLVIEKLIRQQVTDATVVVKILSYRITVLGEVKSPGIQYMYNEKLTLLEALGLAGDLTEYASRKNIKLLRPKNGGVEIIHLDLTDENIVKSPYFFLRPYDVLYVAPMKAKIDRNNLTLATTFFAAVSALLLVINFIKTN